MKKIRTFGKFLFKFGLLNYLYAKVFYIPLFCWRLPSAKSIIQKLSSFSLSGLPERLFLFNCNTLYKMRDLVFIPIKLIKEANDWSWLRSLSYFVKMKSLYKNNTHYGFSLRSLAEKLGCSPACLSYHLKMLNNQGLIRYHVGNITFLGLKKMQPKWGSNNIGVPINFKLQNEILRGQIIRFNLSTQLHAIKKSGLQQRKGDKPLSRTEKINNSYTGLSAEGIGRLFGLSKEQGCRIRKKLKNAGIFSVKKVFLRLFMGIGEFEYRDMIKYKSIPPYSILRSGNILIQLRPEMKYLMGT